MNNNPQFSDPFFSVLNDTARLEKIVDEQPWCSVAQLFLLHNYKNNGNEQLEKQSAKTALFFNNQNWLNWQLHLLSSQASESEKPETKTVAKIEELKKETIKDDVIAFEPFHTVDYFASQGIKLSQEEMPKDKLGKQLKSFTEWLKTMKRLPPAEMASKVDAPAEEKVEHMAEDSVHNAEVVTEAMASVLEKQGKKEKAIELYRKLSFLNPDKSTYFAAQIEKLKVF